MSSDTPLRQAEAPEEKDYPDERPFPGHVRVDLLPDIIRERARVARAKRIVAALVMLVLLALAALWYQAQRDIEDAQAQLDAARATNAELQAELAQYAQVPAVFASASTAEQALSDAMGSEVRWSFLLNQLSFATPPGITLDSVSGELATGGPTQNSPGGVLPPKEAVGTMTFTGTASTFANVAAWLDSLETLKDYTYPFLTNSTKDEQSRVIDWESTADLSRNALSGTYGTPQPGVDAGSGGGSGSTTPPTTPTPQPSSTVPNDGAEGGAQ